jgi:3-methyladenine DNA glycosylase AlkD
MLARPMPRTVRPAAAPETPRPSAAQVATALEAEADRAKAAFLPRFFKTGPGEYGEGDVFIGVTVPRQRAVARRFRALPLHHLATLLDDRRHECRLTALLILVDQYERADARTRTAIARFYLAHLDRVNNWDLVDSSAARILGAHLQTRSRRLLDRLAASRSLWRPRIAIIATHWFVRQGAFDDALRIADRLLDHPHDLIHKAVGWTLREVGNRDEEVLVRFLRTRYTRMPRTMLRYAIEKFPARRRHAYLSGRVSLPHGPAA